MQTFYTKKTLKKYLIIAIALLNVFVGQSTAQDLSFFENDSAFLRTINTSSATSLDLKINEISASNLSAYADELGDYDDWIELYNFGDDTINLNGLYISDTRNDLDKFEITVDTLILPQSYIVIWADSEPNEGALHTNFKLNNEGESLFISNSSQIVLDSVNFIAPIADITYGRLKDNFLSWNYFGVATPGTQNPPIGMVDIIDAPESNQLAGYYDTTVYVALSHRDTSVIIRYTVDGKIPSSSSTVYNTKIKVSRNAILRYRAFKSGYIPSITKTQSFFIKDDKTLDAISIVANPNDLTGSNGILNTRRNDVEKPISVEYFGNDHNLKFKIDGGVQLHSPKSNPQLSLRLYARSDYGNESIDYQIFPNKEIHTFKRLILRNAGNDATVLNTPSLSHFRDGLHHTLFQEMGHKAESAGYKAVNVYINGDYYGIYNMRERVDEYFIESNFGYTGEMDLLERAFNFPGNRNPILGDFDLFRSVELSIKDLDLTVDSNLNKVATRYDLDEFTDYWIHEIYVGNLDWMSNNIKIYRPNVQGAKFKWILWDTDHGSGLPYSSYGTPSWNTLNWSISIGQLRTENGSNNIIQRGLITNEGYKIKFINRYADLLNTLYSSEHMLNAIDSISGLLKEDMKKHATRWNLSYNKWTDAVTYIKDFYKKRPGYVREDILKTFAIEKNYNVTLKSNNQNEGTVKINTIMPTFADNQWSGIYFKNIPITLIPVAKYGYHFTHWGDSLQNNTANIIAYITSDTTFEAHFEKDIIDPNLVDSTKIIISEINIPNEFDSDFWVELVNKCGTDIPLKDWHIETETDTIYIGDIILKHDDYLIVTSDNENDGDHNKNDTDDSDLTIQLYNSEEQLVDSIKFSTSDPCYLLPKTYNFTLELKDLELDNTLAENWMSSIYLGGSPGVSNTSPINSLKNIKLNEILADNDTIIQDDFDEYEDYIELYNKDINQLDIRGLIITDDKDNPTKYQIPNTEEPIVVQPNGFALLWADNDSQGALHVNFKLSKEGEKLTIYQNTGYELQKIDEIEFETQIENVSFGAIYNGINTGIGSWNYQKPTPGISNNQIVATTKSKVNNNKHINVSIYPVPVKDNLYVTITETIKLKEAQVLNILGEYQTVYSQKISDSSYLINTKSLPEGIYLLKIIDINNKVITKTFIK